MESEPLVHVFLVSFPGQGHVNPLLRLGKRLASKGLLVTFSTTQSIGKQMQKANRISDELSPVGDGFIRFEFFDDGWEDDDPRRFDLDAYLVQLELVGKEMLSRIIEKDAEQGRPVSCLINNPFVPWVSDMAESLGIPSALLWVQSCACFSSYYHYFHGLVRFPSETEPFIDVQLPCMPLLKYDEVPSFLHPNTPYSFLRTAILGQYKNLEKPFCILMDTFQELEHDIIEYMSKLCPIKTVGPLFKNNQEAADSNVRGDMMEAAADCLEWLDSKPPASVVYISFGSVVWLKKEQADEIAYGLLNSNVSFLWVIRPPPSIFNKDSDEEFFVFQEGFLEKAGDRGKVVKWSPQDKVLAHPSVACFVSHCGWNSTMEAIASGIPVVAFPQWGDQVTDAKFLVDEFKVGLRLCRGDAENKLIRREEMEKCLLEATVGPKSDEMKRNVLRLKEKAEASVAEGGSSHRNIQAFVGDVRRRSIALTGIVDSVIKSTPNGDPEIVV